MVENAETDEAILACYDVMAQLRLHVGRAEFLPTVRAMQKDGLRLACIREAGRVVESGASAEVLHRPRSAFAARLAGLNLVAGSWRGDHLEAADGRTVSGLVEGEAPGVGAPAVASFRPHSVSVFRSPVAGSPRNSFRVRLTDVEPLGDLVRVRAGDLAADITVQAAADLELAAGESVEFSVKATEVTVYAL